MEMKFVVLIFTVFTWNAVKAQYKSARVTTIEHVVGSNIQSGTFTTKIDHFRPQDSRTLEMQYHSNLNNYQQNGPIYICIKHMTDNSTRWIEEGLMVDIARNNLAGLFTFDQRYFGNNLMFDEFSWDYMRYLTIEQILADVYTFIDHIRKSLDTPLAPVILWGSQFGATLATFARLKYPHLINGVWSSSGIYEIHYYYRVQHAFEEIEDMITNNETTELQTALNLCDPINATSAYEVAMLLERLIEMITQYIDLLHFHGVQNFCHDIDNPSSTPLQSLIRWTRFAYETDNDCFDFGYDNTVERYFNTRLPRLSWFYLQCSQAGLFKMTDQFTWLTNRIELGIIWRDILGDQYNSINFFNAISDLQLHFSGNDQLVTNIVYTNGYIDPWLYDGITYASAENATVLDVNC